MAQDAFLSAYRAYDRFRGQSHVTTWLYRITMNAALMRLRKTKKARTLTHTGIDEVEVIDWTKNPHKDALDSGVGRQAPRGDRPARTRSARLPRFTRRSGSVQRGGGRGPRHHRLGTQVAPTPRAHDRAEIPRILRQDAERVGGREGISGLSAGSPLPVATGTTEHANGGTFSVVMSLAAVDGDWIPASAGMTVLGDAGYFPRNPSCRLSPTPPIM